MKNKILVILNLCLIFALPIANAQTKNPIDSAFIINNMIKAVNQKDLVKVGEELYRMRNGKIKFNPAYIDFFSAIQNIISFKKMDSTSIGPVVLIDSASFNFHKALAYKEFKSFEKLEIKNPELGLEYCVDVMNARGKSYFEMSEWIKSIEAYEKGLSIRKNYNSALGAGLSCLKKEYYNLAQKYFMISIELNPTKVNSFVLLSEAYVRDQKLDSALKIIDGAYTLFKDSITFLTQAYNVYSLKNDTNKCIEVLSTLTQKQSNFPELFYNLGVWLEKKGDFKSAEKNYKSAILILPNEFKYNFNLSVLYFNRYAQLSNDISLKQNLEHYTIDEKILERIVWIDKAKPFANKCLEIQPNNVQVLAILYYYYLTNEDTEKAEDTLKRIEELK